MIEWEEEEKRGEDRGGEGNEKKGEKRKRNAS